MTMAEMTVVIAVASIPKGFDIKAVFKDSNAYRAVEVAAAIPACAFVNTIPCIAASFCW